MANNGWKTPDVMRFRKIHAHIAYQDRYGDKFIFTFATFIFKNQ